MNGETPARADDERLIFSDSTAYAAAIPSPGSSGPSGDTAAIRGEGARAWWRLLRLAAAAGRRIASALETERDRGTGFVLLPVLFAAGAVTYFCLPGEPDPRALLAFAALAAVGALGLRASGAARASAIAALVLLVGMLAGSLETWRHSTLMMGSGISTRITGRVVTIEDRANGRIRLTIDLNSTERPELRYAPDRIRATTDELPDDLEPGKGVAGVVRLLPASGPARPFGYDFAFESFFDGVGANGFFLSGPFKTDIEAPPEWPTRLAAWVERQRLTLAAHIRARIGGPEGEVAAALVAGVRGGIPEEVTEALRKTGLAHILAISGLHMALVAGTVVGAMRFAFALFPGFSSRRAVKKYAAIGGLAALVLYLVLSGAAVAAQRAFIMFAVMLVAVLFDRAALTMRNLAIAALVILAIAPHEVMGPSFQMSFAATAALIGAYSWYSERRMRGPASGFMKQRSPAMSAIRLVALFFTGLAMTSLIAGLATGLFAAWHFQRIAPLGLIANLAAMPVVTIAVMPLAVAGVLTMPFGLDGMFFAGMGKALALVIGVATELAERSPVDTVGAIPPLAVGVLAVALVIGMVMTTWLRWAALPLLAAGLALVAMRDQPDVLISEDARLVAMPLADGRLAVNRTRPSSFTLGIWEAASQTAGVVKPGKAAVFGGETPFLCGEGLCTARHSSGAVVAFAESGEAAGPACGDAALVVVDDATADNVCAGQSPVVVTKKDLAWRGSAEVRFRDGRAEIRYAIGEALRPWHDHRRWSREARGMPPYRRQ
ncbi:MAG: ComEC/Rec2 family competence protein [Rhizobiaceae bacterium]